MDIDKKNSVQENSNLLKNLYRQTICQQIFSKSKEFQYKFKFFRALKHKVKSKNLLNLKICQFCLLKKHQQIFRLFLDHGYLEFFESTKILREKQPKKEFLKFPENFTTFILNFQRLFFVQKQNPKFFQNFQSFSFIEIYKQINFLQQKNVLEKKEKVFKFENKENTHENLIHKFTSLVDYYLLSLKQQLDIFKTNSYNDRSFDYISLIFQNKSWKLESIYKILFLSIFYIPNLKYQNNWLELKLKKMKPKLNVWEKRSQSKICFLKMIIKRITLFLKSQYLMLSAKLTCLNDLTYKNHLSLFYQNVQNSKKTTFLEVLFPEFKFFNSLTILPLEIKTLNFKSDFFQNIFEEFLETKIYSNFCFVLFKKYEIFNLIKRNFLFKSKQTLFFTGKFINPLRNNLNFFQFNRINYFIKVHRITILKFNFCYLNFLENISKIYLISKQNRKIDKFLIDFSSIFENSFIQNLMLKKFLEIDLSTILSSTTVYSKKKFLNSKMFLNQNNIKNISQNQPIFPAVYSPNLNIKIYSNYIYKFSYNTSKLKTYLVNLKKIVKLNSAEKQEILIKRLLPKLYTWCYYQLNFPITLNIFYLCDRKLYELLWKWACRRHNNKSKYWIQSKYFYKINDKIWLFGNLIQNSTSFHSSTLSNNKLIYLPFHSEILLKLNGASKQLFFSELEF